MSIGMIGLTANAVFNKQIGQNFRTFLQDPILLGLTAIFFIVLLSGFWSENIDWLINRLRMKLPFLLLPFAIVAIPKFDRKVYYPILSYFFWITSAICLYSIGLYLLDYQVITESYKRGHVLFTPVMHIRFSLMVGYCIVIGIWLFLEKFRFKYTLEPWLLIGTTAFLFIYIHILAVRSGLVSLYAVMVYLLFLFVIKSKRYLLGLSIGLLLVIASVLAIRFVPTLYNKYSYMRWSLQQFMKGERLADLSDSYRLATIEAGISIGNQHPLLGVGFGDVKDRTKAYLQQKYPALLREIYMPQSEYVLFYAATGAIGLLVFLWATLQGLFYKANSVYFLAGSFHVVMVVSFVVEQTLETQLGTAIYVIFAIMNAHFIKQETIDH